MEPKYAILKTIYEIVKNEFNPTAYTCQPNQIIIRQQMPWDSILKYIDELAGEGLVNIVGLSSSINITDKGMEKAKANAIEAALPGNKYF